MNFGVVTTRLAFDDIVEAKDWYAKQRAGLEDEFESDLDKVISTVAERPSSFPVVGRGLRRARLDRFPYAVFFRLEADRVVVVGVIHSSRDPIVWQSRA